MNTSYKELSVIETFVTPSYLSAPCISWKISEILNVLGILKITELPKILFKVAPENCYKTN